MDGDSLDDDLVANVASLLVPSDDGPTPEGLPQHARAGLVSPTSRFGVCQYRLKHLVWRLTMMSAFNHLSSGLGASFGGSATGC